MDELRRAERLLRYFSLGHKRLERERRRHELRLRRARAEQARLALRVRTIEGLAAAETTAAAARWRGCALDRMRSDARALAEQQRGIRAELLANAAQLAGSEGRLKGAQKLLADAMARYNRGLARIEQAEIDQRASLPPMGERKRV
ncbi:MAG TPA: hypothetical protein DGT21_15540 [Armatimonadetes bacterium]|jgi:hypothetical protein|nr:hypothetical protein [Armatimonadota bacterium]